MELIKAPDIKSLAFNISRIFDDDVIQCKLFSCYWPFVRGTHRSPVNSPHKAQWRGALMFSFICAWINGWVNNREAGDLRRHRTLYDVTVMYKKLAIFLFHLRWQKCYLSSSCPRIVNWTWEVTNQFLSLMAEFNITKFSVMWVPMEIWIRANDNNHL